MAKKGQVQLQTEVTNEDEWEKLLQKDGLILVDVYSEWCGSCQGMAANLKKIKLEIGGDMLQLATAKCDYIEALKRFRYKSEPTWMFISNRKMVNLMFGADAPKLTRLIIAELKLETASQNGEERPLSMEITDHAEEEQIRYDAAESIVRAAKEKEEAKKAKELLDRRTTECKHILENIPNTGVILIFPHAKDKYKEVLPDLMSEAGLAIKQTEKVKISAEVLQELLYFTDYKKFSNKTTEDVTSNKLSLAFLIKRTAAELSGDIDEVVLQLVYGNPRKPPGDEKSPSQQLLVILEEEKQEKEKGENDTNENEKGDGNKEEQEEEKKEDTENVLIGIWAPPNNLAKATALKYLFPHLSTPFLSPEMEPPPLFVAFAYDAFKAKDVMELSEQYPGQVMKYGFFNNDVPTEAKLICKTMDEFEKKKAEYTFDEKIVIQLVKSDSEAFMVFSELGPTYMSVDAVIGEMDCRLFFPPGYDETEAEAKKEKKKPKRRSKKHAAAENKEASVTASEATIDPNNENEMEQSEDVNEEQESDEDKGAEVDNEEDNTAVGADKATSPIHEKAAQ